MIDVDGGIHGHWPLGPHLVAHQYPDLSPQAHAPTPMTGTVMSVFPSFILSSGASTGLKVAISTLPDRARMARGAEDLLFNPEVARFCILLINIVRMVISRMCDYVWLTLLEILHFSWTQQTRDSPNIMVRNSLSLCLDA